MKNRNGSLLVYLLMLASFGVLVFVFLREDREIARAGHIAFLHTISGVSDHSPSFSTGPIQYNSIQSFGLLLIQMAVIVLFARLSGLVFKQIGQPAVVGEIAAGIILGPSVLGCFYPKISELLFPPSSWGNIQFLSQIGLVLFMFVIGLELEIRVIRKLAYQAVLISHASIIIPWSMGMGLAWFLYDWFAPAGISFFAFTQFIGIAMSITAFPVLARIIKDRGLGGTNLGSMALACAASNDITAWCILAILVAVIKAGSLVSALLSAALVILYVVLMMLLVRPLLNACLRRLAPSGGIPFPMMALVLIIVLTSGYCTQTLGINAVFGSFMAGLIMPERNGFRPELIKRFQGVTMTMLLPLFFVYTGLHTQIRLLNDPFLWAVFGCILLVATVGKFGGSSLFARVAGLGWRESLSLGALMNTRGLMELIVLNIGYDLGVLGPQIFTMMVLMALTTTCMTGPALDLMAWRSKDRLIRSPTDQETG
jgi:Kef-type K+ transport system membrane component KefB